MGCHDSEGDNAEDGNGYGCDGGGDGDAEKQAQHKVR